MRRVWWILALAVAFGVPFGLGRVAVGQIIITPTPSPAPVPTPFSTPGPPPPIAVTYRAGWNIVGVPTDTSVASAVGPLYTYDSVTQNYTPVMSNAPLQAGAGYWAYFDRDTTIDIRFQVFEYPSVALPAGHWVLVGNPLVLRAIPVGADLLYGYDPTTRKYSLRFASILEPGQGAWAYSAAGGTLSFRPWSPPPTCRSGQVLTQNGCAWPSSSATYR
jgi:hypothetical protein